MYPPMEIDEFLFEIGFVLLPCLAVYARSCMALERVEAFPEQVNRCMV